MSAIPPRYTTMTPRVNTTKGVNTKVAGRWCVATRTSITVCTDDYTRRRDNVSPTIVILLIVLPILISILPLLCLLLFTPPLSYTPLLSHWYPAHISVLLISFLSTCFLPPISSIRFCIILSPSWDGLHIILRPTQLFLTTDRLLKPNWKFSSVLKSHLLCIVTQTNLIGSNVCRQQT